MNSEISLDEQSPSDRRNQWIHECITVRRDETQSQAQYSQILGLHYYEKIRSVDYFA